MRPSRKPRFVLVFLLVLCALFVYGYAARMGELASFQAEITAVGASIDHARQEQEVLLEELAYVNSPDYVEQEARVIFGMGMEGDRLVVPVHPAGSAATTVTGGMVVQPSGEMGASSAAYATYELPVWQQWVSFFADSGSTR